MLVIGLLVVTHLQQFFIDNVVSESICIFKEDSDTGVPLCTRKCCIQLAVSKNRIREVDSHSVIFLSLTFVDGNSEGSSNRELSSYDCEWKFIVSIMVGNTWQENAESFHGSDCDFTFYDPLHQLDNSHSRSVSETLRWTGLQVA